MKPIKCTKKQFNKFKNSKISGEQLFNEMLEHFKRTSPERAKIMETSLTVFQGDRRQWLYKILDIPNYMYNEYAYMLKDGKTIDGQRYVFLSVNYGNNHIHNMMSMADTQYPEAFYLSDMVDYLNTYLCTYNL